MSILWGEPVVIDGCRDVRDEDGSSLQLLWAKLPFVVFRPFDSRMRHHTWWGNRTNFHSTWHMFNNAIPHRPNREKRVRVVDSVVRFRVPGTATFEAPLHKKGAFKYYRTLSNNTTTMAFFGKLRVPKAASLLLLFVLIFGMMQESQSLDKKVRTLGQWLLLDIWWIVRFI